MRLSVLLAALLAFNISSAGASTAKPALQAEIVKLAAEAASSYRDGNFKASEDFYQQAIAAAAQSPTLDRERAILMTNLGAIYRVDHKFDLSIDTYKEALELKRKVCGSKDASTLDTMEHLVVALQMVGRQAEAVALQQEMHKSNLLIDSSDMLTAQPASAHQSATQSAAPTETKIESEPKIPIQSIRQVFQMSADDRFKRNNPVYTEKEKLVYDPKSVVYVGGLFSENQAAPPASTINSTNSVPVYSKTVEKVLVPQTYEYSEHVKQLHGRHPRITEQTMNAALEDGDTLLELQSGWVVKITQQLDPTYWHGGTTLMIEPSGGDKYQVSIHNPQDKTTVKGQALGR